MSVFLSNLDDFIVPGQACINPLVQKKIDGSLEGTSASASAQRITLETDLSTSEYESEILKPLRQEPNLIRSTAGKVASVSLNDCLACSGCVTSAETILIQQQSYARLMEKLSEVQEQRQQGDRTSASIDQVVVAISPQSRASLAHKLDMSSEELFLRLASMFKALGVTYVVDTSSAGDISLIEAGEEFLRRHEHMQSEGKGAESSSSNKSRMPWIAPPTTTAVSSTKVNVYNTGAAMDTGAGIGVSSVVASETTVGPPVSVREHVVLPMIISSCPGWICYAEKTHPQALPYISTAKSAQQMLGAIFKRFFGMGKGGGADGGGSNPQGVYMVSVQPCFDKKLESSRLDFVQSLDADADADAGGGTVAEDYSDVDLVISTSELWSLLLDQAHTCSTSSSMALPEPMLDVNGDEKAATGTSIDIVPEQDIEKVAAEVDVLEVLAYLRTFPLDSLPAAARADKAEDLRAQNIEQMFRCFSSDGQQLVLSAHSGAGSGGFLDYISRRGAEQLLHQNLWSDESSESAGSRIDLPLVSGRNADIADAVLTSVDSKRRKSMDGASEGEGERAGGDGSAVKSKSLRIAKIYGFRHIQSLMLKMKRGKCEYDLVEVMACPSGCINGGGQLRTGTATATTESVTEGKDRIAAVDAEFHRAVVRRPEDSPLAKYLYCGASGRLGRPLSDASMALLHTRYHAVPKLEELAPLAAKW